METSKAFQDLQKRLEQVQVELEEANDLIEAIRLGEVDALVVQGKDGHQLFTLKSADQTYRIFIEQMTESALTLDRSYRILYSNSQFAKLIGLPLEKVIGQYLADLIVEEDQLFALETMSDAWEVDTKTELRFKSTSSKPIPVQTSLKALDLDEGRALSMVMTDLSALKNTQFQLQVKNEQLEEARQIAEILNNNLEETVQVRTEELEATIVQKTMIEEVLRLNEQRLTSILQTMGEGLLILDSIGQVTFANKRARKIFAMDDELFKKDFFALQQQCFSVQGEQLTREAHPVSITMSGLKPVYDHEISIVNAKNENIFISINASPLFDDGLLSGIVMTFTDVTNRRKIAVQKDEFISVASHEIKTPLTSLKASMQLLTRVMQTNPDSDKIPFLIQKANANLSKVVHLADDLMNVSKIQLGPLPLNIQSVNIKELIRSCADQILSAGNMLLDLQGPVVMVSADYQKIEQVMVNLFNNAIKYAPVSKVIKVTIEIRSSFVTIAVADFGAGIPAEKLPHLFDRYYQVDPHGKQVSGLGLGLYISQEIIERHGGTLTVTSELGKGSVFTFTLSFNG